jgi:ATP-citrate lyase beta-subunit
MLAKHWETLFPGLKPYNAGGILVTEGTDLENLAKEYEWLDISRLVVKPDQLFGKRGKNNLVLVNRSLEESISWIQERMNQEVVVEGISGNFILPFKQSVKRIKYYFPIAVVWISRKCGVMSKRFQYR